MIEPVRVSTAAGDRGLADFAAGRGLAGLPGERDLGGLVDLAGLASGGWTGATGGRGLARPASTLPLDELVPGGGPWEMEIGFGKGRYLLRRCLEDPGRRFLGIEIAGKYQRIFAERARRRGARNWVALKGDALYLLSAVLPRRFAAAVHVYFPDPWPKSRHQKRRLFDAETADLVLGALAPGGRLWFATDFLSYGEKVAALLAGYPGLAVERRQGPWPEGPRTNYEAKYEAEGRPILRLECVLEEAPDPPPFHPDGAAAVLAATGRDEEAQTAAPRDAGRESPADRTAGP